MLVIHKFKHIICIIWEPCFCRCNQSKLKVLIFKTGANDILGQHMQVTPCKRLLKYTYRPSLKRREKIDHPDRSENIQTPLIASICWCWWGLNVGLAKLIAVKVPFSLACFIAGSSSALFLLTCSEKWSLTYMPDFFRWALAFAWISSLSL